MPKAGVQGPTPERLALAERVRSMRNSGLLFWEIQRDLGISRSYAQQLYSDPDGALARARKDSYRGVCEDCGGPTTGNEGPRRCADCTRRAQHEHRYWTREQIISTFRDFHAATGRIPRVSDRTGNLPSQYFRFSAERLKEIDAAPLLPHSELVRREFGSWPTALEACGFVSSRGGSPDHRGRRNTRAQRETLALLRDGPKTTLEIATARRIDENGQRSVLRRLLERGLVVREGRPFRFSLSDSIPKEEKMARTFIVFTPNGDGWKSVDTVEAVTPDAAIEKAAKDAGTYVAVPMQSWIEKRVGQVTKLVVDS